MPKSVLDSWQEPAAGEDVLCASRLKAFPTRERKGKVSEEDGCWKMHSCCSEAQR